MSTPSQFIAIVNHSPDAVTIRGLASHTAAGQSQLPDLSSSVDQY
jgi:hypothetical protein